MTRLINFKLRADFFFLVFIEQTMTSSLGLDFFFYIKDSSRIISYAATKAVSKLLFNDEVLNVHSRAPTRHPPGSGAAPLIIWLYSRWKDKDRTLSMHPFLITILLIEDFSGTTVKPGDSNPFTSHISLITRFFFPSPLHSAKPDSLAVASMLGETC